MIEALISMEIIFKTEPADRAMLERCMLNRKPDNTQNGTLVNPVNTANSISYDDVGLLD